MMRLAHVLTGLLAAGASMSVVPSASAIPERVATVSDLPKDIHGTITIHLVGDFPLGHDDRTFRLTFRGWVESPGSLFAPVDVAVPSFESTYLDFNPETGLDDLCRQQSFQGFRAGQDGEVARGWVDVSVPRIDMGRGRAKAYLSVVPDDPFGEVGTGACGGPVEYSRFSPLVGSVQYGEADSLVGRGIDNQDQQETVSPGWMTLRLKNGAWRSRGSRTSTDNDYGTRSAVVSWDVWSKHPGTSCAVPPRRSVRGKSVANARKELKKYGFPKARAVRVMSSVPSGRVDSIDSEFDGILRCGKRATINVAR